MKIFVIVPSKSYWYLNYLLSSLREQIIKPYVVILVIKNCGIKAVKNACSSYTVPCLIAKQDRGSLTTGCNISKREAKGIIIILFTDDVIAPKG